MCYVAKFEGDNIDDDDEETIFVVVKEDPSTNNAQTYEEKYLISRINYNSD